MRKGRLPLLDVSYFLYGLGGFLFGSRFDPEADMHTISQVENPSIGGGASGVGGGPPGSSSTPGGAGPPGAGAIPMNEDSNHSGGAGSGSGKPFLSISF